MLHLASAYLVHTPSIICITMCLHNMTHALRLMPVDSGYPSYCMAKRNSFLWCQHMYTCGCHNYWRVQSLHLSCWLLGETWVRAVPIHWLQCRWWLVYWARYQGDKFPCWSYKIWSLVSCSICICCCCLLFVSIEFLQVILHVQPHIYTVQLMVSVLYPMYNYYPDSMGIIVCVFCYFLQWISVSLLVATFHSLVQGVGTRDNYVCVVWHVILFCLIHPSGTLDVVGFH